MIDLKEFLLQLNVGIRDGLNKPALDLKLNGSIAIIAYLCTVGKLSYPVYKFVNGFIRPLLDFLQFIDMDLGISHHLRCFQCNQGISPDLIYGLHLVGPSGP